MKLEVGKYYKNSNGDKVGPVKDIIGFDEWCCVDGSEQCHYWDGTSVNGVDPDIIAEWTDGTTNDEPDYAELAAIHGIKITVQVGDFIVEYDGRKGG